MALQFGRGMHAQAAGMNQAASFSPYCRCLVGHTRAPRCSVSTLRPASLVRAISQSASNLVADNLPEPGTPEAPPQVPPSLDTVPGTAEPVENVIGSQPVEDPVSSNLPAGGSDAAAVEEIAAAIQPLMATDGGEATSTEADLFKQNWSAMDTYMRSKGFYNFAQEGPQVTEAGAVKKACVECGRSRPEVIYDVDRDLLKSWLSAYENPRDQGAAAASLGDRKATNAIRRLRAYAGLSGPVDIGQGGSPNFLDIMRVFFAMQQDVAHENIVKLLKPEFLMDGAAMLSAVVIVLDKEPSAQAQARLAEAEATEAQEHERIAKRRQLKDTDRGYGTATSPSRSFGSNGSQAENLRPGDWNCESCGQHNFARNMECFRCQAMRPATAVQYQGETRQRSYNGEGLPSRSNFGDTRQRSNYGDGAPSRSNYGRESSSDRLPENFRPGDWMCPSCSAHNFRGKAACYRCSSERPAEAFGSGQQELSPSIAANPFGAQIPRAGDWTCAECGGSNFARRNTCFKCDAPRTDSSGAAVQSLSPIRTFQNSRSDRSERPAREVKAGDWKCGPCNAHNFSRNSECFRCSAPADQGSQMTPTQGGDFRRPSGGGRDGGYGNRSQSYSRGSDRGSERGYSSSPAPSRPRGPPPVAEDLEW